MVRTENKYLNPQVYLFIFEKKILCKGKKEKRKENEDEMSTELFNLIALL